MSFDERSDDVHFGLAGLISDLVDVDVARGARLQLVQETIKVTGHLIHIIQLVTDAEGTGDIT